MMVARSVVTLILCLALQGNEVVAIGRSQASTAMSATEGLGAGKAMLRALAAVEAKATETITKSMTTQKALELVSNQNGMKLNVKTLLQAAPTGHAGVQKGQDMLNQMIQETTEKLDMERQTCYNFITSQEHTVWVATQDIRMFDARAAGAREDVLAAQAEIERLTELLPQLTSALEEHQRKCAEDIRTLGEQLKVVLGDITVMNSVLQLTECKTSLAQHVVLKSAASKVVSAKAQRLLKESFDEACADDMPLETPESPDALLQISSVEPPKQRAKCTLSKSSCTRLRDRFLEIQSGIEAKREELMAEIASLKQHCADEEANLQSQISDAETDLKDQQTALAKATKEQNDAERNSKLKNEEKVALIAELIRMRKLCEVNIYNYIAEKCALGKIRGELEQMKGHTHPAFLQDCEVTDWSAAECSASCGGGTQSLTRTVSAHPVGGAKCPPLVMQRTCNEEECPVDCALEDWTEWGDCSAECNGGVKEKIRNVLEVPQHNGDPCGETSVTESCNIQACDKDCVLGDWAPWSVCSKECDGGLETRLKAVTEDVVGSGKCAHKGSDARLEEKPCNERKCKGEVICESKLDVVLLLDGSGSLGTSGWTKTKEAAEMFVNELHGGEEHVKVSVILFSGPTTWGNYYRCTGVTKSGGPPNLKDDCGLEIVAHLTYDTASVVTKIKGLAWPKATTFTSGALMLAKTELSLGRADARSAVIVITDGKPLNRARTEKAAKELREVARLMWVPVTGSVPLAYVEKLASNPKAENVVQVSDFEALSDPETVSELVADMCPIIEEKPFVPKWNWVLGAEGQSCTEVCTAAGTPCDEGALNEVDSAGEIKIAAKHAGQECDAAMGPTVGWAYDSNPGICSNKGCCGDGSCTGICAFGNNGKRTCGGAASGHYSRLCPCGAYSR